MSRPDFSRRDQIRAEFSADYLRGHGIEIGGGAWPQRLPEGSQAKLYDLRTAAELRDLFGTQTAPARPVAEIPVDFPQGADFLIAHNVLEHSPNPLGQLIEWNGFVRLGGVVVLSMPHYLYCPDARRSVAPLSHLISDYVESSDGSGFVCREHGASFALGWWEDFCRSHKTESVEVFSRLALENLSGENPDFHWHAYDSSLALRCIIAAALLSGARIGLLRWWRPEADETVGDILIAYRILDRLGTDNTALTLFDLHAKQCVAMMTAVESVERDARIFAQRSGGDKVVTAPLLKPFIQETGHCFIASVPADFCSAMTPDMKVIVLEDGTSLGPSDSLHQTIRDQGGGAFSVWERYLYFSSSDCSDCNQNGRQYTIRATADDLSPNSN